MKKYSKLLKKLDYQKDYSLYNLILLFFLFSIVGWLSEVLLHILTEGTFLNLRTASCLVHGFRSMEAAAS